MTYVGTILKIENNKAYIFTQDLQMVSLPSSNDYFIGQQLTFSRKDLNHEKKGFTKFQKISLTIGSVAAAILLMITGVAIGLGMQNNNALPKAEVITPLVVTDTHCALVVSVDVNPGIQLNVNKENIIIDAVETNTDGADVLALVNVSGKTIKEGIRDILDAAESLGYMASDTHIIMISAVISDSNSIENTVEYTSQLEGILETLEAEYGSNLVTVLLSDPEIIDGASKNDLSVSKELLYRYAQTHGIDLSTDEIRGMSIVDILTLMDMVTATGNVEENAKDTIVSDGTDAETETEIEEVIVETDLEEETEVVEEEIAPKPTVAATSSISPILSGNVSSSSLNFSWTPLNGSSCTYNGTNYSDFSFYKIVASLDDSTPKYPDNGYLHYISDSSASSWSLTPSSGNYNTSPELIAGKTYYFAVTYVFKNGSFCSNTIQLTIPTVASVPAASSFTPGLSASVNGNSLSFSWNTLPSTSCTYNGTTYNNFNFYKVVASKTDDTPIYGENGWLYYTTDLSSSGWSVTPFVGGYNTDPVLESGQYYYFSITYVFDNGKVSSNTVQLLVP